jgi:hypothetical protein
VGEQTIEPPNESERDWIETNLGLARELVAAYTGSRPPGTPDASALDDAYAAWLADWRGQPPSERDDPNIFVNAFGLAFGQCLADALELSWAVATDDAGTEIAVHGQPGDVLVFPPNLVGKRFERGETHFFAPVLEEIRGQVQALRGDT